MDIATLSKNIITIEKCRELYYSSVIQKSLCRYNIFLNYCNLFIHLLITVPLFPMFKP